LLHQAVLSALSSLGLEFPLSADRIVNSGRGASDGIGFQLSGVAASKSVTSVTSAGGRSAAAAAAAAEAKKALFDTGGVLANSASTIVELGDGNQRDALLGVLFLYQQLPQLVPKTNIEFRGALGQVVTKTIELKNPTRRSITYHVSLDGASEYSIAEKTLKLEAESLGSFTVQCTTRFSEPVFGRLTFRSRREGGMAAATMVFLLCNTVTSRPPVQTVLCETPVYRPVMVDVDVANPFASDCTFKVSVVMDGAGSGSVALPPKPPSRGGQRRRPGQVQKPKGVRHRWCASFYRSRALAVCHVWDGVVVVVVLCITCWCAARWPVGTAVVDAAVAGKRDCGARGPAAGRVLVQGDGAAGARQPQAPLPAAVPAVRSGPALVHRRVPRPRRRRVRVRDQGHGRAAGGLPGAALRVGAEARGDEGPVRARRQPRPQERLLHRAGPS
jgi:hypothetical protein